MYRYIASAFTFIILTFVATATLAKESKDWVNVSYLKEGEMAVVTFNKSPICIYHRTSADIMNLRKHYQNSKPADEDMPLRSKNENIFIFQCASPVSGCKVSYFKPGVAPVKFANIRKQGGFLDKCSGQEYNFSGQPYLKGNEKQRPLEIPNHHYESSEKVIFP